MISHDREFLDDVSTHILHLHDGKAKLYIGDYTDFERQRAEHLRLQQITHEKEQAERAHLQSFIDRFKAKASKAKQAQSRMKRLAKMAGTEAVRAERSLHITLPEPLKLPNSLLSLHDVDAGYGADAVILHNVGFGLEAGDRIGLLGPNGAGKSTLVKTLVGELRAAGRRAQGAPGPAHRLLRPAHGGVAACSAPPRWTTCARWRRTWPTRSCAISSGAGISPASAPSRSIDTFSGGEKARLALALIAYRAPERAAARRTHQPPRPGHARGTGRGAERFRRRHRDGRRTTAT